MSNLLRLIRFDYNQVCTRGALLMREECFTFTLEPPNRKTKILCNTCIPAGIYELGLRFDSPMATHYRDKFGTQHKGMIWLLDVPGYEYVYFHVGNTAKDTDACILVGEQVKASELSVGISNDSYSMLFPVVYALMLTGDVFLSVEDIANAPTFDRRGE